MYTWLIQITIVFWYFLAYLLVTSPFRVFSSEEGEIYDNNTRIKIEPIYDGLRAPTNIAFVGPDDMLVLQKENKTILRIVNGQMLDEPVLDLGNTVNKIMCIYD